VVEYCLTHGIQVIAYRPLGGRRKVSQLRHEAVLRRSAARCRVNTRGDRAGVARDAVGYASSTIPGATRVEDRAVDSSVHTACD
jgi:hypothetical protein